MELQAKLKRTNDLLSREVEFTLLQGKGERKAALPSTLTMETAAWSPRVFVFHNLLTDSECDYIVETYGEGLFRSKVQDGESEEVVDVGDAQGAIDKTRTSSGKFLTKRESRLDEVVAAARRKAALLSGIPDSHQEDPQVLHYEKGQFYAAHFDYGDFGPKNQRVATILFYLSDVEGGGETHFPRSEGRLLNKSRSLSQETVAGSTAEGEAESSGACDPPAGLAVKPVKGTAILFFNMDPQCALVDEDALHEGCPVIQGDKYSMTVWMHQQSETRARFYQLQQQIAADLAKANDDDEDMEEATSP